MQESPAGMFVSLGRILDGGLTITQKGAALLAVGLREERCRLELTDEDKRLIDERLATHHQNPNSGSPSKEVYTRIRSRKK